MLGPKSVVIPETMVRSFSSVRARSAAIKPCEMNIRATASPMPGPAPRMAITCFLEGLWDIVRAET